MSDKAQTRESVRKEGHRLNVSISEIRRRRQGWPASEKRGPCQCAAHVQQRKEDAKAEGRE